MGQSQAKPPHARVSVQREPSLWDGLLSGLTRSVLALRRRVLHRRSGDGLMRTRTALVRAPRSQPRMSRQPRSRTVAQKMAATVTRMPAMMMKVTV